MREPKRQLHRMLYEGAEALDFSSSSATSFSYINEEEKP